MEYRQTTSDERILILHRSTSPRTASLRLLRQLPSGLFRLTGRDAGDCVLKSKSVIMSDQFEEWCFSLWYGATKHRSESSRLRLSFLGLPSLRIEIVLYLQAFTSNTCC